MALRTLAAEAQIKLLAGQVGDRFSIRDQKRRAAQPHRMVNLSRFLTL
ncbi:MAG: hypothetical protein OXI38_03390 [Bacteroidota bacterium]|nr:hypothetical protein [Bacteroidota bacterium]